MVTRSGQGEVRLLAVVMGLMGLVWAPTPVWADERAEGDTTVIEMAPIQVEGQRIENVESVKKEFAKRPGSNILIEEKQIVESRALNLNDVLQFAPGVRFQSRFGADEGQFQIRGTSLRNNFHHRGINILINGIYFGDADGFSDFESIDLLAYERIEVYKGANALRYGANSIGGAINFVPRTGYSASMVQMRMLAGSFGLVSGQVSSGKVTEPFKVGDMNATADYYISVSGNRQDGYQDHSQQARERINANVGLQLGTHQEIRAYFLQALVSEAIPGALTQQQLFDNRKQAGGQTPFPVPGFFACVTNNLPMGAVLQPATHRGGLPKRIRGESVSRGDSLLFEPVRRSPNLSNISAEYAQRRRGSAVRQHQPNLRHESLADGRDPAPVHQPAANPQCEHQRYRRGARTILSRHLDLHRRLRRRRDRCCERSDARHRRPLGSQRPGSVDPELRAGRQSVRSDDSVHPDDDAACTAAFRRVQSETRRCLSHYADVAIVFQREPGL